MPQALARFLGSRMREALAATKVSASILSPSVAAAWNIAMALGLSVGRRLGLLSVTRKGWEGAEDEWEQGTGKGRRWVNLE